MIVKIPITYKNIKRIEKIFPILEKLTLTKSESHESSMRCCLNDIFYSKKNKKYNYFYEKATIYCYYHNAKMCAWSMVTKQRHSKKLNFMVYVDKKSRRRGFGTLLLEAASNDFNHLRVFKWSTVSECFYNTNKKLYQYHSEYYRLYD